MASCSSCDPCGGSVGITSAIIEANTGAGVPGPAGPPGCPLQIRSFAMTGVFLNKIIVMFTTQEMTIEELRVVIIGANPSVTWNMYHAPAANSVGTAMFSPDAVSTSVAAGDCYPNTQAFTASGHPIPPNSYIWVDVTSTTGIVDQIFWNISYYAGCTPAP